jgi:hypothetical protein
VSLGRQSHAVAVVKPTPAQRSTDLPAQGLEVRYVSPVRLFVRIRRRFPPGARHARGRSRPARRATRKRYALLADGDPSGFQNPKGLWRSDSFDASSEEEGGTQVRVYDRVGNDADVAFTVTRDVTAPGVSLAATAEGAGVALVWSASDGGSGLAGCELVYREGAGAWQPYSAACVGDEAFALAQPGTAYTFHLTATVPFRCAAGMLRKLRGWWTPR